MSTGPHTFHMHPPFNESGYGPALPTIVIFSILHRVTAHHLKAYSITIPMDMPGLEAYYVIVDTWVTGKHRLCCTKA